MLSNPILLELSEKYGTPLYVYHLDRILQQYKKLVETFERFRPRIFYASKALTNINILHYLYEEGCNLDCVSINEIEIALSIGISPKRILFTPSCPDNAHVEKALEQGVHVHIDTLSTLDWLGKRFGSKYPVGLRINPHLAVAGGTLNISTAHVNSKFGISISHLDEILRIVKTYQIPIVGLHQHTGSDVKDATHLVEGFRTLTQLSTHFNDIEYIDIGGGFKVPYHTEDIAINLASCANDINAVYTEFTQKTGKQYQLWFEPGKYLVSESGYLLAKTNVVKRTPTKIFAGVNSGFHHLIRPMFYGAYHRIENISNPAGEKESYDIVGNLCETDTFAENRLVPKITEGDILCLYNAGAYGYEMSSQFNSQFRPAEVMIHQGKEYLIRKRDTLDDLLRNQLKCF